MLPGLVVLIVSVCIVSKYLPTFYPTNNNMVENTGGIKAGESRHEMSVNMIPSLCHVSYLFTVVPSVVGCPLACPLTLFKQSTNSSVNSPL